MGILHLCCFTPHPLKFFTHNFNPNFFCVPITLGTLFLSLTIMSQMPDDPRRSLAAQAEKQKRHEAVARSRKKSKDMKDDLLKEHRFLVVLDSKSEFKVDVQNLDDAIGEKISEMLGQKDVTQ